MTKSGLINRLLTNEPRAIVTSRFKGATLESSVFPQKWREREGNKLAGWLVGWLVELMIGWLVHWMNDLLVGWLVELMIGWLVHWMNDLLVGWLVGWLLN